MSRAQVNEKLVDESFRFRITAYFEEKINHKRLEW